MAILTKFPGCRHGFAGTLFSGIKQRCVKAPDDESRKIVRSMVRFHPAVGPFCGFRRNCNLAFVSAHRSVPGSFLQIPCRGHAALRRGNRGHAFLLSQPAQATRNFSFGSPGETGLTAWVGPPAGKNTRCETFFSEPRAWAAAGTPVLCKLAVHQTPAVFFVAELRRSRMNSCARRGRGHGSQWRLRTYVRAARSRRPAGTYLFRRTAKTGKVFMIDGRVIARGRVTDQTAARGG